jgi:hypothetical protein
MVLFKSSFVGHLVGSIGATLILLLVVSACKKIDIETQKFDFYPLNDKLVRIYEVIEVNYAISEDPVPKSYFLKEKISQIIANPGKETSFIIERLTSKSISGVWRLDSVWSGNFWPDKLVLKENNKELLKLVFPVQNKVSWNLNKFNTQESTKAEYEKTNIRLSINKQNYDGVIKVKIKNDSTAINLHRNLEYYAPNIGLIAKEIINVDYCQSSPSCIGKGIINYGAIKKITLVKSYLE